MKEKIISMINFAIRARKYSLGESVISLSRGGKIKLALIAKDCSSTTKKMYYDKLNFNHVHILEYMTKSEIGSLLGKKEISVIGFTDINMAKQIIKLIKEDETNGI